MQRAQLKGLFLAHSDDVRSYLRRQFKDPELASDLTQETFVRLAEQAGAEGDIKNHRSYLLRIAHNLAVDHIRRQRREAPGDGEMSDILDIVDDQPDPAKIVGDRADLAHLLDILQALPLRTREVFVATRIERQSYREAAARLNISESSVQKHLAQALAHVMQHFEWP
ncbi:MAG: RNA polymerase sigma factor [Novosphingobium sp.]